jgi:hypothetical protein
MFDNIINLNKYLKPPIREDFALISGGNKTSISDSTKVTKSFENNQKINRSMVVESVTKLMNTAASTVIQNNSSSAASAAGASNILSLTDVNCGTVVITGVDQNSESTNQTVTKAQQANTSKISNEISTTIDKTIEKVGATDLGKLQAENTKQLNDFMSAMPGYDPDKAQKLASKCPKGGGLLSAGNKCDVNTSYELDASVKQALDLDESFKIDDKDDISNDINSKVSQSNFAECKASASADNAIILNNITCASMEAVSNANKLSNAEASGKKLSEAARGRLEISDIQQKAVAKLYMTCVFDQKNTSEIANKIVNSISKKYNQIYDAVAKKGEEKGQDWLDQKMKLVDTFAAAGAEKLMAAAGNLPPADGSSATKTPDSGTSSSKTTENKSDASGSDTVSDKLPTIGPNNNSPPVQSSSPASRPANSLANQPQSTPTSLKANASAPTASATAASAAAPVTATAAAATGAPVPLAGEQSLLTNPWIIYGGIGFVILIIFIIIVIVISKSND